MKQFLQRKKQLLLIMLGCYVAVVAYRYAFLRTHFYFSQDEARDILLMQQKIDAGEWIVAYGPKASVGDFYLPPFYYQVHVLVTRVFGNQPWAMHLLTLLIESATPLVFFAILSRFFSKRASALGALLYAISFQPVTYGVNAWNPNMIPFFSMLALYGWLEVVIRKRYQWIPVSLLCLTLAIHLHYQAVLVLPFALIVFAVVMYRHRLQSVKWWLLGAAMALLVTSPYIGAEARNDWHNTRQIIQYFTRDHAQYYDRVSKRTFITKFIPGYMERSVASTTKADGILGLSLLITGAASLYLHSKKHPARQLYWLLLYYALILLMLRVYKGDKLDYYLSTLLSLPALCAVALFELVPLLGASVVLVLSIIATNSVWSLTPTDQLRELRSAISNIDSVVTTSGVRLIFQNDDFVNLLAYGLFSYSRLAVDQNSLTVIEVFSKNREPSNPIKIDTCGTTDSDDYYQQLRVTSGYTTIARVPTSDYHIDVATLQCQPTLTVPHPLLKEQEFGSDSVLPTIFSR